jgi:ribosomal protein S20
MEAQIQLIQVTPEQLANLISESVKTQIKDFYQSTNKEPHPEKEKFLTRKETADFFRISLYTIHDWMKKGIIKPYKAGNRTYFKEAELIEVLNQSNTK